MSKSQFHTHLPTFGTHIIPEKEPKQTFVYLQKNWVPYTPITRAKGLCCPSEIFTGVFGTFAAGSRHLLKEDGCLFCLLKTHLVSYEVQFLYRFNPDLQHQYRCITAFKII